MAHVGYEEKQYEGAANLELALNGAGRDVWPCGQVAESVIGYDVAAKVSKTSSIWKVLKVIPKPGITLSPTFWQRRPKQPPQAHLPSKPVSIIFQYKRPDFMKGSRAKYRKWWSQSYYKIDVSTPSGQMETLAELETKLKRRAIVRYAAPVIPSATDLFDLQDKGQVLGNSNFVAPARLLSKMHKVWTYVEAGNVGHGNPDEELELETWADITPTISRRDTADDSIIEHLKALAEALGIEPLSHEGLDELAGSLEGIPAPRIRAIHDMLEVGSRIGRAGASWWIAADAKE